MERNVKTRKRKKNIAPSRGLVILWQLARACFWLQPICHSKFLSLLHPSCYPAFCPTSLLLNTPPPHTHTPIDLRFLPSLVFTGTALSSWAAFLPRKCLLTNSYSSLKTEFNTLSSRMPLRLVFSSHPSPFTSPGLGQVPLHLHKQSPKGRVQPGNSAQALGLFVFGQFSPKIPWVPWGGGSKFPLPVPKRMLQSLDGRSLEISNHFSNE